MPLIRGSTNEGRVDELGGVFASSEIRWLGGPTMARSSVMTTDPSADLRYVAAECVTLVTTKFGRHLDWSLDSLSELDTVCADLLADGPIDEQRLNLWWKLIGAYTGEVLIRVHGGQWITHDNAAGAFAVSVSGMTAFPFRAAERVLQGEPFKSLVSFGRVLPALVERARQTD
jgi:hypothetical protein